MLRALRQIALQAANTRLSGSVLRMLDKKCPATTNVLAVVTYHRVDQAARTPYLYPGLISATPEQFCQQLDMLSEFTHVVSMQDVVSACRGQVELPARSVLITFDDAAEDFADFAWPQLQARNMPVTVFVPTAYPDNPEIGFWWDRLYAAVWHGKSATIDTPCGHFDLGSDGQRNQAFRTLRDYVKKLEHRFAMQLINDLSEQQQLTAPINSVLGWGRLRELAAQGVTLAPHTRTHPLLTRVCIDVARNEVIDSFADLKREIGKVPPVFAYPGGACNQPLVDMMQDEGVELAFTVKRGINNLKSDDLRALCRINVGQKTTAQILHAQLMAGWWSRRWK